MKNDHTINMSGSKSNIHAIDGLKTDKKKPRTHRENDDSIELSSSSQSSSFDVLGPGTSKDFKDQTMYSKPE